MQYATLLAFAAAMLGVEAKISFTQTPGAEISAGEPVSLKWDGETPDAPVTITLKKGNPEDLRTVALLTGDAKDNQYVWTPSEDLENGDDYALEISQGVDSTNYSGEFEIKGAKAAASSGGYTVTITSGTSSYITTEAGGASTGTAYSTTTRTSNMTVTSASPTGGIQVSSDAPSSSAPTSSTANGVPAAVTGSLGGLAAALIGAVALL